MTDFLDHLIRRTLGLSQPLRHPSAAGMPPAPLDPTWDAEEWPSSNGAEPGLLADEPRHTYASEPALPESATDDIRPVEVRTGEEIHSGLVSDDESDTHRVESRQPGSGAVQSSVVYADATGTAPADADTPGTEATEETLFGQPAPGADKVREVGPPIETRTTASTAAEQHAQLPAATAPVAPDTEQAVNDSEVGTEALAQPEGDEVHSDAAHTTVVHTDPAGTASTKTVAPDTGAFTEKLLIGQPAPSANETGGVGPPAETRHTRSTPAEQHAQHPTAGAPVAGQVVNGLKVGTETLAHPEDDEVHSDSVHTTVVRTDPAGTAPVQGQMVTGRAILNGAVLQPGDIAAMAHPRAVAGIPARCEPTINVTIGTVVVRPDTTTTAGATPRRPESVRHRPPERKSLSLEDYLSSRERKAPLR